MTIRERTKEYENLMKAAYRKGTKVKIKVSERDYSIRNLFDMHTVRGVLPEKDSNEFLSEFLRHICNLTGEIIDFKFDGDYGPMVRVKFHGKIELIKGDSPTFVVKTDSWYETEYVIIQGIE